MMFKSSRRNFLRSATQASAFALVSGAGVAQGQDAVAVRHAGTALDLPVLTEPDMVMLYAGERNSSRIDLSRAGMTWTGSGAAEGASVQVVPEEKQSVIWLECPEGAVQRIRLRWKRPLPAACRVLGDAWERSYGDLQWRPLQAELVLPWYALVHLNGGTAGMGVKTGAACFAFWQMDRDGISLWLDVRNGSHGVRLGKRKLQVATIVQHPGAAGENAFATAKGLCRQMAAGTKVVARRGNSPVSTIYGTNDWYYAYGKNTPEGILRDADLVASLTPAGGVKPFTVIDDGYQDRSRFPDMQKLAADIRSRGVLPGVWVRPLQAAASVPSGLLLPNTRVNGGRAPRAFDPTVPEALEAIAAVTDQACGWGYDLIKHDFTTYELFGQWGSQMGASPAQGDWHFNDQGLTNAEIVTMLYRRIRRSCGEQRIILGCNTVGHLSVGLFDASRTGDDVSGKDWERTRRMGINTLAFRLPQHGTFFSVDADCVPLTRDVPWAMSRQWLQAVADTGTVLLISPEPGAVGPEQRAALREAFAQMSHTARSEPVDWLDSRTPAAWKYGAALRHYEWLPREGGEPFPIGIQRGPE